MGGAWCDDEALSEGYDADRYAWARAWLIRNLRALKWPGTINIKNGGMGAVGAPG